MATPNRPGRPAIEPQSTGLLLAAIAIPPSQETAEYRRRDPISTSLALAPGALFSMLAPMSILCVTANVAVDRTLNVPGFTAGGVWRALDVHAAAGGKGLNVARALLRLGRRVRCTGPLGGAAGGRVAKLAEAEGLPARWTWIGEETRTSVIVVGSGGSATVINEPGPAISDAEWARFVVDVACEAMECATTCISGSMPSGYPGGGLARLIGAAAAGGRPVWVDSSDAALAEAVAAAPAGIKINGEEAETLLGRPVRDLTEALAAAQEIVRHGPEAVSITIGAGGAVLVNSAGEWHAAPPPILPVNPVGSGDCFLAGLVASLSEGRGAAEALRLATACGAANALAMRAGDIEPADVQRLALDVVVHGTGLVGQGNPSSLDYLRRDRARDET
jgi:1-phosphofructokinase family hexose kinase